MPMNLQTKIRSLALDLRRIEARLIEVASALRERAESSRGEPAPVDTSHYDLPQARIANALYVADKTLAEAIEMTDEELLALNGIGEAALHYIRTGRSWKESELQDSILAWLAEHGRATIPQIGEGLVAPRCSVRAQLRRLTRLGKVESLWKSEGGYLYRAVK